MKKLVLLFMLAAVPASAATEFEDHSMYCSYLAEYALIASVGRMVGITEKGAITNAVLFAESRGDGKLAPVLKGVVGKVYAGSIKFPAEAADIVYEHCMSK